MSEAITPMHNIPALHNFDYLALFVIKITHIHACGTHTHTLIHSHMYTCIYMHTSDPHTYIYILILF